VDDAETGQWLNQRIRKTSKNGSSCPFGSFREQVF